VITLVSYILNACASSVWSNGISTGSAGDRRVVHVDVGINQIKSNQIKISLLRFVHVKVLVHQHYIIIKIELHSSNYNVF
jgi:hypothetical protein